MASPQTENGYTRIANELLEAICLYPFSANDYKFILQVIRDSYGWHRKQGIPRSKGKMAKEWKIPKSSIIHSMRSLVERNVLIIYASKRMSLNKNYESWGGQPIDPVNPLTRSTHCPKGVNPLTPTIGSKESTKERLPPYPPKGAVAGFESFWINYPRKEAKVAAERAWKKLSPSGPLFRSVMAALIVHKNRPDWRKEGGRFIPLPASWLNGRRWEDKLEKEIVEGVNDVA